MTRALATDAPTMHKSAKISACGLYRTTLTRHWDAALPPLPFWLLNPSTADVTLDDPTVRRGMGFARREGKGGIVFENAYSFRATNPKDMRKAADPFGPENYNALRQCALTAARSKTPIVCGWGANWLDENVWDLMAEIVKESGVETVCLGKTKDGFPRHPLYVRADQPLIPFYFMRYPYARAV